MALRDTFLIKEEAIGQPFFLLHNDGHNTPDILKFRDQAQAEDWLIHRFGGGGMRRGYFNEEFSWEDPNGDSWEQSSGALDVHDMTKKGPPTGPGI